MAQWEANLRLRVAVLAGGDSAEREVSRRSGAGVAAALEQAGHLPTLVDPSHQSLESVDWSAFDVCFIALHGGAGEDGRIQRRLDQLGVRYTGSGSHASRLAMSKSASKELFTAAGVPTLSYERIEPDMSAVDALRRVVRLGFPLVLKPDAEGSSVGLAVARTPDDLSDALSEARDHGGAVLAEPLVVGREFTVALLDDCPLPMIEIVAEPALFTYDAKYHSSQTEYHFDFQLTDDERAALETAAVGAARALGTSGLVRVDLMLDQRGQPWVLEVNTIPGMTVRSLAPLAAARAGLDMPALCDLLVCRCLATMGVL